MIAMAYYIVIVKMAYDGPQTCRKESHTAWLDPGRCAHSELRVDPRSACPTGNDHFCPTARCRCRSHGPSARVPERALQGGRCVRSRQRLRAHASEATASYAGLCWTRTH